MLTAFAMHKLAMLFCYQWNQMIIVIKENSIRLKNNLVAICCLKCDLFSPILDLIALFELQ